MTLHVGPRGGLGYGYPEPRTSLPSGRLHPLNSLVVFADVGDELTARQADEFSLEIDGPFSADLSHDDSNLVLKAAKQASLFNGVFKEVAYSLTKNLPVSSGIGGGSADAAAAVRLLGLINEGTEDEMDYLLLETGADVPVCYLSKTCIMQGVGENLTRLPTLGQLHAILVNPGVAVSTKQIFEIFDEGLEVDQSVHLEQRTQGRTLLEITKSGRNDLQSAAISLAPIIQTVLDTIEGQTGCQLARMSGSGATCFGIFETRAEAELAAKMIAAEHTDWWCVPTVLGEAL